MPSTIGKCKIFRIKHATLLENEIFLRNKHETAFFLNKVHIFLVEKKILLHPNEVPSLFEHFPDSLNENYSQGIYTILYKSDSKSIITMLEIPIKKKEKRVLSGTSTYR